MSQPDRDPRDDAGWRRQLASLRAEEPLNPMSRGRTIEDLRRTGILRRPARLTWVTRAALATAAGVLLLLGGAWWGRSSAGEGVSPGTPRFALFLLEDSTFQGLNAVGHDSLVAEYSTWASQLAERRQLVLGEELGEAMWQLGGGTQGDPAAARQITGLFILAAADHEAALAIARGCPHLRYGGGIIVRPIQPT